MILVSMPLFMVADINIWIPVGVKPSWPGVTEINLSIAKGDCAASKRPPNKLDSIIPWLEPSTIFFPISYFLWNPSAWNKWISRRLWRQLRRGHGAPDCENHACRLYLQSVLVSRIHEFLAGITNGVVSPRAARDHGESLEHWWERQCDC